MHSTFASIVWTGWKVPNPSAPASLQGQLSPGMLSAEHQPESQRLPISFFPFSQNGRHLCNRSNNCNLACIVTFLCTITKKSASTVHDEVCATTTSSLEATGRALWHWITQHWSGDLCQSHDQNLGGTGSPNCWSMEPFGTHSPPWIKDEWWLHSCPLLHGHICSICSSDDVPYYEEWGVHGLSLLVVKWNTDLRKRSSWHVAYSSIWIHEPKN